MNALWRCALLRKPPIGLKAIATGCPSLVRVGIRSSEMSYVELIAILFPSTPRYDITSKSTRPEICRSNPHSNGARRSAWQGSAVTIVELVLKPPRLPYFHLRPARTSADTTSTGTTDSEWENLFSKFITYSCFLYECYVT